MAPRIPRYEGPQERVLQVRPMEDAALQETRNMMGTISRAVNQMADFAYKQEARAAEQRGMQRVADQGAQSVLSSIKQAGGPTNIEERAAVEAGNRIASAEIETQAILEMNQVLAEAEKNEIPLSAFQAKMDDITDGMPAALSDLNPMVAGELQAKLQAKAGILGQNYADFFHKKQMKAAQGRALIGIDSRQQAIYQLAASNSPSREFMIDRELRNLQQYMQDLQFGDDQVANTFLTTRNQAIEEGIRFDFSELGTVQDQMDFINKLEKSPPKVLGREESQKIATSLRTQMNTGVKVLKGQAKLASDRIADLTKIMEAGGQIDNAQLVKLETELNQLNNVIDTTTGQPINLEAKKDLQELKAVNTVLSAYRQRSPDEMRRELDKWQGGIEGAGGSGIDTTLEVSVVNAAQKLITNAETNLKKNGLEHATTVGLVQPTNINFGAEPAELFNSIQKRRQDLNVVRDVFPNYKIGPLRSGEVQILKNALETGTVGEQMNVLGSIVGAFRQDSYDVFDQVSKDAPLMAHVGGLMLMGKQDVARMILEGRQSNKVGGPLPTDLTRKDIDTVIAERIGGSLQNQKAEVRGAAVDASTAIFRYLVESNGISSLTSVNDSLIEKAVNLATGGDGNIEMDGMGGIKEIRDRQVLVPEFMSGEDFESLIDNLTVEQVMAASGMRISPELVNEIKETDTIFPVAVGGDMYVFLNAVEGTPGKGNHISIQGEELQINMRELYLIANNKKALKPE